jgi:hypothetical protein
MDRINSKIQNKMREQSASNRSFRAIVSDLKIQYQTSVLRARNLRQDARRYNLSTTAKIVAII